LPQQQPKNEQPSGVLPTLDDIVKIVREGDNNKPSEVEDPLIGPINLW